MKISKRIVEGVTVIKPEEKKIDAGVALEFKAALIDEARRSGNRLLINLSDVEFIDSSGLGALVSVIKGLGNEGRVVLCEARESVLSILELTRLDKVLELHHSEKEALDSIGAGRKDV